jgi:hypothetical protein
MRLTGITRSSLKARETYSLGFAREAWPQRSIWSGRVTADRI